MALSDSALEEMTRPKGSKLYHVPESPDYSGGTAQRAQRGVAKPADIVRSGVNKTIDVLGLDNISQNAADMLNPGSVYSRPGSTRGFSGLGSLQEKDYSSMLSPEQMGVIENGVKNAILQSDEMSPEEKQQAVGSMSGSNALEFIEQILTEASKIPDEEVSSMPLEVEEEAEGYIDEILGTGAMDKLNQLGDPRDINFAPTGMNYGGPVQSYNRGGLASMGRGGDSQLAHVMPGETMVPPGVMDDGMLDAAFIRAGLDPNQYKVGSAQNSINPRTGLPEYGLFSRLWKKVRKIAPIIGSVLGFSMGGNIGAGIGKAIGGVIKTGDLDFQRALTDFGTGWAMGNFATGMGMQGNQGFKSIFGKGTGTHIVQQGDTLKSVADQYGITEEALKNANEGLRYMRGELGSELTIPERSMWGWKATDPSFTGDPNTVGGFIQSAGAKTAGMLGASGDMPTSLVDEFKNLPMGQKLGVGALGLAALSQTGMFDKEQRGDVPENITQGMQGLENYVNEPLRAYNPQPVWGQNAPLINIPQTQSAVSPFMTTRAPSLSETLSELSNNRIGLDFPSFNPG